jgi:hypothetical protein
LNLESNCGLFPHEDGGKLLNPSRFQAEDVVRKPDVVRTDRLLQILNLGCDVLGLTDRQRTNTGWYLVLDRKAQKHIHELILAYGVDNKTGQVAAESRQRCDFCMGIKEPQVKIEYRVADNGISTYTIGW